MDIQKAFGKAIKLRRTELDFSQEELAGEAKLARSFVSGVERGESNASPLLSGSLRLPLNACLQTYGCPLNGYFREAGRAASVNVNSLSFVG